MHKFETLKFEKGGNLQKKLCHDQIQLYSKVVNLSFQIF